MARAGRGARDAQYGRVPEDALSQAAGARYFAMDAGEDVGEAPAAERPAPLLEVRPQERVQQRTVEQIVDPVPFLCRRWWNSWWTFFHLSISTLPSRLSKCPRSSVHHALLAQSSVRRRRWNSWWKCRRLYPIPLYFSGLWSRTSTIQLLVVVELVEVFLVFSQDRILQRCGTDPLTFLLVEIFKVFNVARAFMEQITVSPNPGRGLQNFPPVQSSAASSSVSPGHAAVRYGSASDSIHRQSAGHSCHAARQVRTVQTVQLVYSTGAVLGDCRHARCCA